MQDDPSFMPAGVPGVRRAKLPGYRHRAHAGYGPGGVPLQHIETRRFRRAGPPSQKQLDQRARFGAFMRGMKGRTKEEIAQARSQAFPNAVPRGPRRETKGREFYRYSKLQRKAAKLGLQPMWHTSQGMSVARRMGANGKAYPGRAADMMIAGRPYGSQWVEDGVLHGSGRVYG